MKPHAIMPTLPPNPLRNARQPASQADRQTDPYWYRLALVATLGTAAVVLGVVSDALRTATPEAWAADAGWIAMILAAAAACVCFVAWFMMDERA